MLMFWFDVCRLCMIWVGIIQLKLNFRIFAPTFFIFKKLLAPRVFKNTIASRVSTYHWTMPWWWATVGDIRNTPEGVKNVKAYWTYKMWEVDFDGYRWVHPDAVSITPPNSAYFCGSVRLFRMLREMLLSPYPHMEMLAVAWLEWIMGGLLVVSPKLVPLWSKGCDPTIANNLVLYKASAMSTNKFIYSPALLECT